MKEMKNVKVKYSVWRQLKTLKKLMGNSIGDVVEYLARFAPTIRIPEEFKGELIKLFNKLNETVVLSTSNSNLDIEYIYFDYDYGIFYVRITPKHKAGESQ